MSELIEVYRNSVQTWECDQMGHMNVQFYVAKATTGLNSLAVRLGLGPAHQRSSGTRLIATDHHIRFLREQHAGTPITVSAGVLDVSADGLRVFEQMNNAVTGEVAATFVANVGLFHGASRERHRLPESAVSAARALQTDLPGHAAPRGLEMAPARPAPDLAEAESLGMRPTYEGEVLPGAADRDGYLATGGYMGIVSDAYPNVFAQAGEGQLEDHHGGAAVEYRFIYRDHPRTGDILPLRSAVKSVTDKTYTFCHWLFDAETGTAVATAEVVAVTLDLKARRAVPVPATVREGLQGLLVPGVTA